MSPESLARQLASFPAVGRPSAALLRRIGAEQLRGRVLELCGYMPDVVEVPVPRYVRSRTSFHLTSANQTDQIAWRLWADGWNGFEQPLPDLFAAVVRQAHTVLDVGANSGLYAMIAVAVSDTAVVHAFEPLPAATRCLRTNARLNDCNGRLKIIEAAVAERNGSAELFVPAGNESLLEMSASLNSEFRALHAAVLRVQMITIDEYVHQNQITRVDVMKIDVESQEHRVLQGAQHVLDSHRPIIFLEVLPSASVEALEALRHQFDYRSIRLRPTELARTQRLRVDPAETNQVLCPREKLDEFCSIAKSVGYGSIDEADVLVEVKKLPTNVAIQPATLA